MAEFLGQLHSEPFRTPDFAIDKADGTSVVLIQGKTFYRAHREDGMAWFDYCQSLTLDGDDWFIAVRPEDGWIYSAEKDPTVLALPNADIWRIQHPGPDTAIRAHKWTGSEIEIFPGMEGLERT